ncbi:fumarylpyruvate hydrolase [Collimonas sp. OK607]|uniref:fumarylacetoacetate hydrolase family protein n=1 Tax=Collimonas sp. OK607 TaxID=1798194 RepID=UPI0008F0A6E8|nr:fumarylacetoacetate hydrolase family protein [Collimonas sp. OK607]SFB38308.1 fumarylpyruvate hydrolase [Collimonas sp. OK607]
MEYAVTPAPIYTLSVAGQSTAFPVNRIFCVGRNYAAHAREMGKDPEREAPFFFMKPACAAVAADEAGITIAYPPKTNNFHHEIELVVAIGTGGANISIEHALQHVYGYAVGLDMTRRDLQLDARDKGRPWEFGKSFAQSAPIGPLHRAADIGHPTTAAISLTVNDASRQSSDIDQLIWSVAEAISYLSEYEVLEPGDIIMTGTPAGVNAVNPGDVMRGAITGLGQIVVRVAQ